MFGKLHVRVRSAKLTRDTEIFGQMDPYCLLTIGGQKEKTKVHKKGGKKPRWDQEFSFVCKGEEEMLVDCFDEDTFKKDDLVGTGLIQLNAVLNGSYNGKVIIYYKKKSAGELYIDLEFTPVKVESSLLKFSKAICYGVMNYPNLKKNK